MKRNLKQITLIFLVLAMVFSISTALVSCNTGSGTTGGLVIPGIGTSGTTAGSDGTQDGTQGTTAATTTAVTPPANEGDYINPLTGLKTTYDATGLKPIAVVVDNVNLAYAHQTGLTQADIMYETLIAPGISRLTILISDYNKLTPICNIRSAQLEHLDIIGSHNAIMVAHGGSTHEDFAAVAAARLGGGWNETFKQNTFGYINTLVDVGFTAEGGAKFGTIKYYSKTYAAFVEGQINKDIKDEAKKLKTLFYEDGILRPDLNGKDASGNDIGYDTLLTTDGLMAVLTSKYSRFVRAGATKEGTAKSFNFVAAGTEKVMNGAAATKVELAFGIDNASGKKSVVYNYDSRLNMYLRSQDGAMHVDAVTGEQLAFTNVITLFTDVTSSEVKGEGIVATTTVVGEGTGYYFYGGEAVEIKWTKSAWDADLVLTDKDGNALEIARGTTYVGYLDNTDTTKAVAFN
jgi:hypothetical protein